MTREALKQALEALEGADQIDVDMQQAITAIKAALAQPDHSEDLLDMVAQQDAESHLQAVSDFGQLQEQEPVAWISNSGVVYPLDAKDEVHPINELQPLFMASLKRPPLTKKEIETAKEMETAYVLQFARAIEAAHGIGDKT